MVPLEGIEPPSALYKSAAKPLSYNGIGAGYRIRTDSIWLETRVLSQEEPRNVVIVFMYSYDHHLVFTLWAVRPFSNTAVPI